MRTDDEIVHETCEGVMLRVMWMDPLASRSTSTTASSGSVGRSNVAANGTSSSL